jgi:hypothetical protein
MGREDDSRYHRLGEGPADFDYLAEGAFVNHPVQPA